MTESLNHPENLLADLKECEFISGSSKFIHSAAPSKIKRINKILGDKKAQYFLEFDPYANALTIQIFSKHGRIYVVIPEGDSANEN